MVKSIITVLISALIFIGGSICEQVCLNNSFQNFRERLIVVYEKTEDETITAYDVKSVQDLWIKNKKTLHVFISHNDIKELDMWISESLNYVKQKNYGEALDKIEVAIELTEQIPKGYLIRFETSFNSETVYIKFYTIA